MTVARQKGLAGSGKQIFITDGSKKMPTEIAKDLFLIRSNLLLYSFGRRTDAQTDRIEGVVDKYDDAFIPCLFHELISLFFFQRVIHFSLFPLTWRNLPFCLNTLIIKVPK